MEPQDRYHRQELIWGKEGQHKLSSSTITIIGEDSFAFPAALNAVLLGVNTRLLINGRSPVGEKTLDFLLNGKNLAEEYYLILSAINPFVTISYLPLSLESELDNHFLNGSSILIDLTNNPTSKQVAQQYALKNSIPFVSTSSIEGYCVIEIGQFSDEYRPYHMLPKDLLLAWPIGALATEKAKRFIFAEERAGNESLFLKPGYHFPFVSLQHGESPRPILNGYLKDKIALVVGVGGQGCFAVPIFTSLGCKKVIYMDNGLVEETNLSRQPLYWDSVGRPKAEVCAKKHNQITGRNDASYIADKFDEDFNLDERIDIIYGFTDTYFSRMAMSNYASRHNIIFVSAGSDPTGAHLCFYVPGKTTCFTHLHEAYIQSAREEERQARLSCTANPNPQVVMPNCFAGSMAAILSAYLFDDNYVPFNGRLVYVPGLKPPFGTLTTNTICTCHVDGPLDIRL